jgi:cytochrome bd-type quinol oxidase subunit 2
MNKKISGLFPVGMLVGIHICLCIFMIFTAIGAFSALLLLPCVLILPIVIPMLFYYCGKWTEEKGTYRRFQRGMIALISGAIYAAAYPFLMDLADFISWGHWSAFTIDLSLEEVLYVAVPFCLSFLPCWIGMEVQCHSRCDSIM